MLALSILGLLMGSPMHGYEIRKQLSELLGYSTTVSYGSLYPTLAKLHRLGYIETTTAPISYQREQIFSTGSLTGDMASLRTYKSRTSMLAARRNKKIYTISEKGMAAFKEKLIASYIDHADNDRAFMAHLAFLDYATEDEVTIFLNNRIDALRSRLQAITNTDNHALKLWNDVQREYIENQITFLLQFDQNDLTSISDISNISTKEKHDTK